MQVPELLVNNSMCSRTGIPLNVSIRKHFKTLFVSLRVQIMGRPEDCLLLQATFDAVGHYDQCSGTARGVNVCPVFSIVLTCVRTDLAMG
jgi:hypothetical protein